jgi:hypothetical protein
MFEQKAGLTGTAAGMKQAQAAADQAEAGRQAAMWSNIGQGVGAGAAGMGAKPSGQDRYYNAMATNLENKNKSSYQNEDWYNKLNQA